MDANIADKILAAGAAEDPALYHGPQVVTHGQLRESVCRWASLLLAHGAEPGERIGLWAENSPWFVAAYLGIIRAGCCAVPFPTEAGESWFARAAAAAGMKRVLISGRFRPRVGPWAAARQLVVIEEAAADAATPPAKWPDVDPRHDLAALMFTSGSTGEAKGVMVSHRNIACNTDDILAYTHLSPRDRTLAVLPFYYCYGASLLHSHLMAGASLVLNNSFLFPESMLDEMEARACTGFAGVPSTYQILLRKTNFVRRQFPSLRWLQQAGGRLATPFIRQIRTSFPAVRLYVMYGQTEGTARLSYLPPERLDDKLGSIGCGLRHTTLEVLRPDGTPVTAGSDEVGEIVAAGENICAGYWNDPQETARYFRGGKLFTGDMARRDADGFIYVVERSRDFIKALGNRVSPKEIEEVISELPDVVETAVIGVADDVWGEAIRAYVSTVGASQLTADAVRRHCLQRLPPFKVPEQIEFLPRLPKTANGKIAKEELRRMACEPAGAVARP
jgi:long-chain acyl-CoA synthetase